VWEDSVIDPVLPAARDEATDGAVPGRDTPQPGTWEHFTTVAPPWLVFWWEAGE